MTDLTDLIARVEKLEGPDREVNATVLRTFGWTSDSGIAIDPDGRRVFQIPDVTASLDAALALARRVLPQCRVLVESDHQDRGWAMVCAEPGAPRDMTDAPTPALALILALLRALQSATTKEREE